MAVRLQTIATLSLVELVGLFNRSFAGYTVPVSMSVEVFAERFRSDGVDPAVSQLIYENDRPAGVALIARRGFTSRLSAMGLVPDARGRGAGKAAMRLLLEQARGRGEREMVLEVIEQNEPAVRLYSGCGFERLRRLVGFNKAAWNVVGNDSEPVDELDIRAAARVVTAHAPDDLPWQASGESLVQLGPPWRAFGLDGAVAVVSDPNEEPITLRSLAVPVERRREGRASRLLEGLARRFPGRAWRAGAIVPEELSPLFEGLGYMRDELSQFLMKRQLTASDS